MGNKVGNKFKQWTEAEIKLLTKLYKERTPLQEIYKHFPQYEYRRVYNKLTYIFPADFQKFTMRTERNYEKIESIDYGSIQISVIEVAKNKLGDRITEIGGSYYLDGKRCLVQDLIRVSKQK